MTLTEIAVQYRNNLDLRRSLLPDVPNASAPWLILLDLFIAQDTRRQISVSEVGLMAHLPGTTSLRWVEILESQGLLRREKDLRDRRRQFISLFLRGIEVVSEVLKNLADMPAFSEASASKWRPGRRLPL